VSVIDLYSGQIVHGWDEAGREWRDSEPWTGIFPPRHDAKGRPLGYWSKFLDGKFVEDLIDHKQGGGLKNGNDNKTS